MRDRSHPSIVADMSVADRIALELRQRIVTGVLAPGLPVRQDHVATEFGASHVPVREAFRVLEAQGLLVSLPRRGVRVAPIDPAAIMETAVIRAGLETLALRHAAPQLTPVALDAAAAILEKAQLGLSLLELEVINRRFHMAITAPCGLPRLVALIDDMHQASARYLFAVWKTLAWQDRSDSEHAAILDALRAGDISHAAALLEAHILSAGEALVAAVKAEGSTSRVLPPAAAG